MTVWLSVAGVVLVGALVVGLGLIALAALVRCADRRDDL